MIRRTEHKQCTVLIKTQTSLTCEVTYRHRKYERLHLFRRRLKTLNVDSFNVISPPYWNAQEGQVNVLGRENKKLCSKSALLEFPGLAIIGANTTFMENGIWIVCCGIMNRNLWLQCKGDFLQRSGGNHQENVHLKLCKLIMRLLAFVKGSDQSVKLRWISWRLLFARSSRR